MRVKGRKYFVDSSGSGPALLLLHGFTGSAASWQALRQRLEDSHRVLALDLIGHGRSDKPASPALYQMESAAADIISLLDQLGIDRVHLLGYSMGGRLALYLALHFGARFDSLCLESSSPGLASAQQRDERRRRDNQLADRIEADGIAAFVDFWERLPLWNSQRRLPAALRQAQRRQRLSSDPRGLANSLRGMGTGVQPSLWRQLPALSLPTQLIVGAEDAKFQRINREMAKHIPQARLSVIPAAGHNAHLENPRLFHQQLRSFLQGL